MDTIALALGAGGARGLAHIHTVQAFDDLGIKPKAVAGTSMGSIIGATACAGMSAEEITDHIYRKISNPLSLVNDMFKVRAKSLENFFKEGGPRIGEFNLERILDVFLPDAVPETFAELSIPLYVAATDFYGQITTVFKQGDLLSALASSSAMPAVFLPVKRDDRFYIDGSATNPCPIEVLQDAADHLIAIDVSGGPDGDAEGRPNKIDAVYGSNQMMQASIIKQVAAQHPKVILLRPPVGTYRSLDFLKAKDILAETEGLRDQVKCQIDLILS